MKVTILVLTHQQPALLEQFVSLFPGPDFNFIVYVDKGVQIRPFYARLSKFSNVTFVKERRPVFWCGHSTLRAIMLLLEYWEQARERGDWIFFVSGTCFPLMNPKRFVNALDAVGDNQLVSVEGNTANVPEKHGFLTRWHFHDNYILSRWTQPKHLLLRASRSVAAKTARLISSNLPERRFDHLLFGSSWWGINRDAAEFVLQYTTNQPALFIKLKYCNCPEEFYFQNVLSGGGYKIHQGRLPCSGAMTERKVYGSHFIDWGNGGRDSPLTLYEKDFTELIGSGAFFARKISEEFSRGLIERLVRHISL